VCKDLNIKQAAVQKNV